MHAAYIFLQEKLFFFFRNMNMAVSWLMNVAMANIPVEESLHYGVSC